jgi:transglutaminase-like putative cysteine protease
MSGTTRLTIVTAVASLLAMLPLVPITASNAWLVPATGAIALVVLTGAAVRRTRAPRGLAPLAQLVALTLWLGLLVAADVAWLVVIPTLDWFERLAVVVGEGLHGMAEYAAPVPVDRGMQFMLVAGAGLIALGVDLAVFGLRRVPLAGPVLAVMYAVAATVVREGWSWVWFVPPAVAFLALLVAEGRNRVSMWGRAAGPSPRHARLPETDSLARNGRRVGAVAIAAAVAVPAGLPALTEGFVGSGGGGSGSGSGRIISTDNPIVDLKRDLIRPDNVDMLRYATDTGRPEYIRTATLDAFNGEEWSPSERPVPNSVHDGLPWPPGLAVTDEFSLTEYEIEVTDDFGSSWLPLAYPAHTIEIDGDWRYDQATLDVVSPDEDVQGISYRATSIVVSRDAEELRAAPRVDPEEYTDMLDLPDRMRGDLRDYLDEAIGELTNPHEQAVTLQAWFRSEGGFEYSLEPGPGTSSSHLIDFLEERTGYCEQYAATMAIMARALGIPARVAVGFTPGEQLEDGTRLIRARDAHAWPELYFDGTGWVRFEPTPSLRTGAAPAWTLPPRDEAEGADGPAGGDAGAQDIPNGDDLSDLEGLAFDDGMGTGAPIEQPARWPVVLLALLILGAVLATPHGVSVVLRARRWQRAAGDPGAESEAAWADFRDAVRDTGVSWDDSATPRGLRRHVLAKLDLPPHGGELVDHLVTTIERARYAAQADPVPDLRPDAAMLRRAVLGTQGIRRRLRAWLWPTSVKDLISATNRRLADGMTWLDSSGEQLRNRMAKAVSIRR